jgi:hypothetical protein
MKFIDDILPFSETIVSVTTYNGVLILATQRTVYNVWQDGNDFLIKEIAFNEVH